jgi:hypothetical protein
MLFGGNIRCLLWGRYGTYRYSALYGQNAEFGKLTQVARFVIIALYSAECRLDNGRVYLFHS